jgi:hypothetical protein
VEYRSVLNTIVRMRSVESELALLDGALERRLFFLVELAITIHVIRCDVRVHSGDMIEHHFSGRFISIAGYVNRELQLAICNGFLEALLFRCVQLAILVRIE